MAGQTLLKYLQITAQEETYFSWVSTRGDPGGLSYKTCDDCICYWVAGTGETNYWIVYIHVPYPWVGNPGARSSGTHYYPENILNGDDIHLVLANVYTSAQAAALWKRIWQDSPIVVDGRGRLGHVQGKVTLIDPAKTPINNAKVTVNMYNIQNGDIKYSHTYDAGYTASDGRFSVDVSANPFSMFSWDYYEFIAYGGWNLTTIMVGWCNGNTEYDAGIAYTDNRLRRDISINPHLTHRLTVKDDTTGNPVQGAEVTYYDTIQSQGTKTTDINGEVSWNTAHPCLITYRIVKEGYRTEAPIFDLSGTDISFGCTQFAETLISPLTTAAFISLDKSTYTPDMVMVISYDTMFKNNCKIQIMDGAGQIVYTYALGLFTRSPPTLNYPIAGSINYGRWTISLIDDSGTEIAHSSVTVGTEGSLSYNTSNMCSEAILKILFSNINPVFKPGYSNRMHIELTDGANTLVGEFTITASLGTWSYTKTGREDETARWTAKLIDQWGSVVDMVKIDTPSCSQVLFGKITRRDGSPVKNALVSVDLSWLGFGIHTATTNTSGIFTFTTLPSFPSSDISFSKTGYAQITQSIQLNNGEMKEQNVTLEGLVKGNVTDIEGYSINDPTLFVESSDGTVSYTDPDGTPLSVYKDGVYDIIWEPLTTVLHCIKKNFVDYMSPITVSTSQVIQDITLVRPVPVMKYLAVEGAEASLDDSDTNIIFETSGQNIALIEQGIIETGFTYSAWGKYQRVSYLSKQWFAGYTTNSYISNYTKQSEIEHNRLHRIFTDDAVNRPLYMGSTLTLSDGYVLKLDDIDSNTRKAMITVLHNGYNVYTDFAVAGDTFIYRSGVSILGGLPTIAVHINNVFAGAESSAIFIDGLFQIFESYTVIDMPPPPSGKYLLRQGAKDQTGLYTADASSNIIIDTG